MIDHRQTSPLINVLATFFLYTFCVSIEEVCRFCFYFFHWQTLGSSEHSVDIWEKKEIIEN